MLTAGDEFPLHQTPEPVAFAGTDRNFYDRYFFNGCTPDGETFFAVALGIYPALDIADAHISILRGGTQHCLHASIHLGMERMALQVGPIGLEVIEPLRKLRVRVERSEGIAADFTFTGRAFPIEEPRFTHRFGPRTFMDYTRMTQNGHYAGWLEIDGETVSLPEGAVGTRDRSWGIRPVGARDPQASPSHPLPNFFWQWTPVNLPGGSLFWHLNADPDGTPWNSRAAWVADGGGRDAIAEGSGSLATSLQPGSRWPSAGKLALDLRGAPSSLRFEPTMRFQMRGIGYTSPDWGHGLNHGPLKVEREDFRPEDLDPLAPENLHVQQLCHVDAGKSGQGWGVFEQLILGPYAPLGLGDYLGPASERSAT